MCGTHLIPPNTRCTNCGEEAELESLVSTETFHRKTLLWFRRTMFTLCLMWLLQGSWDLYRYMLLHSLVKQNPFMREPFPESPTSELIMRGYFWAAVYLGVGISAASRKFWAVCLCVVMSIVALTQADTTIPVRLSWSILSLVVTAFALNFAKQLKAANIPLDSTPLKNDQVAPISNTNLPN